MIDLITGQEIFSPLTILVRLSAALMAGLVVGIEREKDYQPAGMRTHMVLALGACTIMLTSMYLPTIFIEQNPNADPGRMAAQVISGIGFLGAGAIFRYGFNVKGLTTAASIWTIAGIGLAFGAGFYILGGLSTVFLILILNVFNRLEIRIFHQKALRVLTVVFKSDLTYSEDILKVIRDFDLEIEQISVMENIKNATTEIVISCRMKDNMESYLLIDQIKSFKGIKSVKLD